MQRRLPHHTYLRLREKVIKTLKTQTDFTTDVDHLFEVCNHDLRVYEVIDRMACNSEVIYRGRPYYNGTKGPAMYKLAAQFTVNL